MKKNHSGYKPHCILGTGAQRLLQEASPFLRLQPGKFLLLETQTKNFRSQPRPLHAPSPPTSTRTSLARLLYTPWKAAV